MATINFNYGNGLLIKYVEEDHYKPNVVAPENTKIVFSYAFRGRQIKSIEFLDGLLLVNDFAFSKCPSLETLIFPSSLKTINGKALSSAPLLTSIKFKENSELSYCDNFIINKKTNEFEALLQRAKGAFTIPSSIKSINSYAFYKCSDIPEIILNEGLEEINSFAFSDTPLLSIKIPKTVKNISPYAFEECNSLRKIVVSKDNPYYESIDGVLYTKDLTRLIAVPKGKTDSVIMPDSVSHVYKDAFYNSKISSLTLSKNLEELETFPGLNQDREFFQGCNNLMAITAGSPKFKITLDMFNVHTRSNYYTPMGTNSLQRFLLLLPSFYPSQLTPKYQKEALNMNLHTLMNKSSNNKDWQEAWYNYIKRNASKYFDNILKDEELFSFVINEKLLSLKDTKTLIDRTRKEEELEKLSILLEYQNNNYSVEELEKAMMKELSVDITSKNYIRKSFGLRLINNKTEYEIIGYKGQATEVIVPKTIEGIPVTSIADGAFSPTYGGLNDEVRELRRKITSITLPDTITKLGKRCFLDLSSLTSITLSKGLKEINSSILNNSFKGLFQGCINLPSLVIPEGVETIGEAALLNTHGLKHITLPSTLKTIGPNAFTYCENIQKLIIPEGVTTMEQNSIVDMWGLKKLTIPSTVKFLDKGTIGKLTGTEITINNPNLKFKKDTFFKNKGIILIVKKNGDTERYCKTYNIPYKTK